MDRDELRDELHRMGDTLSSAGFDVREIVFEPVATDGEVADLERRLGVPLPTAFRRAFLSISRHVEFRWFAPTTVEFPPPFRDNFCGDLHWSLELTMVNESARRGWATNVFPDSKDPYDNVWHSKLAFHDVGNGDLMAIDLSEARRGAIVYLSHDDGEGHGKLLARDFDDLLDRWVPLGCPGGEDWQWLPFVADPDSGINPGGTPGRRWRSLLGI